MNTGTRAVRPRPVGRWEFELRRPKPANGADRYELIRSVLAACTPALEGLHRPRTLQGELLRRGSTGGADDNWAGEHFQFSVGTWSDPLQLLDRAVDARTEFSVAHVTLTMDTRASTRDEDVAWLVDSAEFYISADPALELADYVLVGVALTTYADIWLDGIGEERTRGRVHQMNLAELRKLLAELTEALASEPAVCESWYYSDRITPHGFS